MTLNLTFLQNPSQSRDVAVVLTYEGDALTPAARALDQNTGGFVAHAIGASPDFTGKSGQVLSFAAPTDVPFSRLVVLGLGVEADASAQDIEDAGGMLFPALKTMKARDVALYLGNIPYAEHLVMGVYLRSYAFDRYKTVAEEGEDQDSGLHVFEVISPEAEHIETHYERLGCVAQGVFLARNLVNEPPNVLYPEAYADIIRDELKPLGVSVEVFDEKKMDKLGMGGILAVGQGSARKPRMVIMEWKGKGASGDQPLALVGKGVTFDTGGISIKPGAGMDEMKMDMGGSAAVVGAMKALALRKAPAHVVAIVGLAENMPSSNAYRPGDIITSYAGKTIEVLNTDAEGRLVLADALTYVQREYKPSAVIDLATLTGAMMVALGHEYCGTFVNDDSFWEKIERAGEEAHEKLWRMPLDKAWKKEVVSAVADLRNLGKSRFAGACTAAGFLEHFIEGDISWAHMDIAGMAWVKVDKPVTPKFGTGFAVRTLEQLVYNAYEKAS